MRDKGPWCFLHVVYIDDDYDNDEMKTIPCNGRYVIAVELTVVDHDLVHVDWTQTL